jgi:hypothetical protein
MALLDGSEELAEIRVQLAQALQPQEHTRCDEAQGNGDVDGIAGTAGAAADNRRALLVRFTAPEGQEVQISLSVTVRAASRLWRAGRHVSASFAGSAVM